ncbi:polysaccharide deacetylase family protein [Bacillus sp. AK031]
MVDCTRVVYDSTDENVITHLNDAREKTVMLTFDDGPARVLRQILDILKKEQVQAVFFWQSRLLHHQRPWKRVLDEGHIIGNHSTNHKNLTKLSQKEQYHDLAQCQSWIQQVTGQKPNYFRPPFGQYNQDTLTAAGELGMKTVMWRIASMDWELQHDSAQILKYVLDNLEDGAIILLHELPQTVKVLPELIRRIKEKGFQFGVLDA